MRVLLNNINIESCSSYLPAEKLVMRELSALYGVNEVESIIKTTGIREVRVSSPDETASDMCFKAAQHLFECENISPDSIDGLVFVSQSPDYILPATSIVLQDRLGLTEQTVCIDIHYGCSGYIYGLYQAALWITSGSCKRVLVLAGDTTTKMINPNDKSLRMVFGDCGTATIMVKGDNQLGISINSDGGGYKSLIIPAGGFRRPYSDSTRKVVFDEERNGRSDEDLYMDGMTIFNFAINNVHKDINELIDYVGWEKDSVDIFALHQANDFMLGYISKRLGVSREKVPSNVELVGNTGPSSIPLLLTDLYSSNTRKPKRAILSGFGVGLSWGSISCNLSLTNFHKPINY